MLIAALDSMNLFVRILVNAAFAMFSGIAIYMAVSGAPDAAVGALVLAGLVAPLLLEVWFPGRYALRKPIDGSPDTLSNRVRLFRRDHPGWDGTAILAALFLLWSACLVSSVVRLFWMGGGSL